MGATTFSGPVRAGTKRDTGVDRNSGTAVLVQYKDYAYTDQTQTNLCVLPAGSRLIEILVDSVVSVNAGTSGSLDIGIPTSGAFLVDDLNVKTLGRLTTAYVTAGVSALNTLCSVDTTLTYTVVTAGTVANQGSGTIIVVYSQERTW